MYILSDLAITNTAGYYLTKDARKKAFRICESGANCTLTNQPSPTVVRSPGDMQSIAPCQEKTTLTHSPSRKIEEKYLGTGTPAMMNKHERRIHVITEAKQKEHSRSRESLSYQPPLGLLSPGQRCRHAGQVALRAPPCFNDGPGHGQIPTSCMGVHYNTERDASSRNAKPCEPAVCSRNLRNTQYRP